MNRSALSDVSAGENQENRIIPLSHDKSMYHRFISSGGDQWSA